MSIYKEILIDIAVKAGAEIMKYYRNNPVTNYKSDDSPVTVADLAANKIIIEGLLQTGLPILSEESAIVEYNERKHWKKFWIIDPLDGTKQFVKNQDEFTVNIALIENNMPIEGVVFAPALQTLYYGNLRDGAMRLNTDSGSAVSCKTVGKLNVIKVVASKSHLNIETKAFLDKLKEVKSDLETVQVGSSLKFCIVAEGKADLYPRLGPICEWDIAAGHAVLKSAGGNVISLSTGEELLYNSESLKTPDYIAFGNTDMLKFFDIKFVLCSPF